MADSKITDLIDPANKMLAEEWLDTIEDIAEDHGFFEPLGPDVSATFIKGDENLLVTFETMESVRSRSSTDVPLGWEMATSNGWSQLCLIASTENWFRHPAVYQFFDRLIDDGFFDDHDRTLFYGSESCGYAAAAFSVAAPGSTVIAISPQASLDPRVSEWDDRFLHMRRVSFTDRFGYAPDMAEAAQSVFVLYDPESEMDAMHAALFSGSNITRLRCRHLGDQIEAFLRRMDVLENLLKIAMRGQLRPHHFHVALRERRNYLPYLRRLLGSVEQTGRPFLTAILCRSVLGRINTPRFRRQLQSAKKALREEGRRLPNAVELEVV